MLSSHMQTYLRSSTKVLNIIWIAFQVAAAVYYVIARIMGQAWTSEDRLDPGFVPAFWVLAALSAIASILYQRWAFSDAKLAASPTYETSANSVSTAAMARNETYQAMGDTDKGLVKAFAYIQVSYIVTWAFQEAIAIFGLIMAIVTRDVSNVVIFNVAALALLFATRPASVPLLERVQRLSQTGAKGP
ncbi:hypothetical protein H8E07_21990 [bacterium]|nr:hypothetical protein [bacterium]